MNILLVMAHPDDAEIWCGGTIIHHVQKGDRVKVCVMAYSRDSPRGKESCLSAELMGNEVELFGLGDTKVRPVDAIIDRLVGELVTFRPELYITHWFDDIHPDHEATFHMARAAFFRRVITEPVDNMRQLPYFLLCDTYGSNGLRGPFRPNHLVDVSGCWDGKLAAIRAHGSQPTDFFIHLVARQCREHGLKAGVALAEGFIRLPLSWDEPELSKGIESAEIVER